MHEFRTAACKRFCELATEFEQVSGSLSCDQDRSQAINHFQLLTSDAGRLLLYVIRTGLIQPHAGPWLRFTLVGHNPSFSSFRHSKLMKRERLPARQTFNDFVGFLWSIQRPQEPSTWSNWQSREGLTCQNVFLEAAVSGFPGRNPKNNRLAASMPQWIATTPDGDEFRFLSDWGLSHRKEEDRKTWKTDGKRLAALAKRCGETCTMLADSGLPLDRSGKGRLVDLVQAVVRIAPETVDGAVGLMQSEKLVHERMATIPALKGLGPSNSFPTELAVAVRDYLWVQRNSSTQGGQEDSATAGGTEDSTSTRAHLQAQLIRFLYFDAKPEIFLKDPIGKYVAELANWREKKMAVKRRFDELYRRIANHPERTQTMAERAADVSKALQPFFTAFPTGKLARRELREELLRDPNEACARLLNEAGRILALRSEGATTSQLRDKARKPRKAGKARKSRTDLEVVCSVLEKKAANPSASQAEIARMIDVDATRLSKIKRKDSPPSAKLREAFAKEPYQHKGYIDKETQNPVVPVDDLRRKQSFDDT